jgi:hypothetical protein
MHAGEFKSNFHTKINTLTYARIYASQLWKNFQITHACRRVLAHFSDKVNALLPAFIPVNCGKVPNPFDLKPLVTKDAGRKQTTSSPAKITK